MKIVELELGADSYCIHIGNNLLDQRELVRGLVKGNSAFVVTNETIAPLLLDRLICHLDGFRVDTIALPDGEQYKTLATLDSILTRLLEREHKRSTTIFALGGGVVGDTAGFAAACYQRGVSFVQVPTTLLAQVDSSVGGKTAVNHPLGKNMIGAFYQPDAVLIDTTTLVTLPDRELRAGLAEIIKHGALADARYFDRIEATIDGLLARDPLLLEEIITRSCEIKAAVVASDEKETGRRALLNLGHTFGHAIENALGYGTWLHGEAVAAGMVMAADLSARLGHLPAADARRLAALIARAGLPVAPPDEVRDKMLGLMARDKKATESGLTFILLRSLGEAFIESRVDPDALLETIQQTGATQTNPG